MIDPFNTFILGLICGGVYVHLLYWIYERGKEACRKKPN